MILKWGNITTAADIKPMKNFSPCFWMPFTDKSWMKGMDIHAMNSILKNAWIERGGALSNDKEKSTECTEFG